MMMYTVLITELPVIKLKSLKKSKTTD